MTTNPATFLMTKPHREAVVELALAYHHYIDSLNFPYEKKDLADAARRLIAAQDALGVQMVPTNGLQPLIDRESEAA